MAHDDDVPAERLQGANGVEQRLALLDGRPARGDVGDVGGQRLRGELEGDPSAGRCLGKEQDDRAPAQRRCAPDRSPQYFGHRSGLIEHGLDLLPRPVIGVEDVTAGPPHAGTRVTTSTSSRPSTSARCTRTSSPAAVGTFLPTKSARIGSSQCPRSTSTARRIVRPVNSTSSTRTTTRPSTENGISDSRTTGAYPMRVRSSRYRVMSIAP